MAPYAEEDFDVDTPLSPTSLKPNSGLRKMSSNNAMPIPSSPSHHNGAIEVPASRSSHADTSAYMNNLSLSPSMRQRRPSRNSFGASLPIPRPKRQSRLSSVAAAAERPGLPTIQSTSKALMASQLQDQQSAKVKLAKNMAFAFDIDGVLVHGDRLIPEGKKALDILNGQNELGITIPHIFLTNGSGKTEDARVKQLSGILQNPISTEQFIQSHTPMQALSEYYDTVLVVGGDGFKCRDVAETYGFKNIVVPHDIVAWDPTIAPYRALTPDEKANARPRDFGNMNIDAILVFSDSRDYGTDLQIIMDLLRSEDGRLGTKAKDPLAQRIPIYFSQGDLLCPTEHPIPRMSQGTFRIALEAMYKSITGVELDRIVYGKPEPATYLYSEEIMASWMGKIHNEERIPDNVFMVGDNGASDICGGNNHGWNTCLVRTGVFQGGENDEENPANFGVFDNVLGAVKAAMRKELGDDFKFEFNDDCNPINHAKKDASAIA